MTDIPPIIVPAPAPAADAAIPDPAVLTPAAGASAATDPVPLFVAGTRGLCPRCGAPTVYAGLIKFADRCSSCGLDFTELNVGDGPAAFLTLIIGTIIVAAAVFLQIAYDPPVWVQMLIWVPVTAAAVVASLRVAKGVLLTVEYRQAAHQGKLRS